MAREPTPFRRVVLGMGPGSIDLQMLRSAAEFARLLELEMLGIFIEDPAVLALTDLPFVRELRLLDRAWRPFDALRVAADLRAAAEQARRQFDREGAAVGVACHFEIRRGDPATLTSSLSDETDIIVMAEPATAAERATTTVVRAQRAALTSPASVLFLPATVPPRKGPVAVFAASAADPAHILASRIAALAGEEAVLIPPPRSPSSSKLASLLASALAGRHERLVVMTRGMGGSSDDTPLLLAAERNIPVLSIEPPAGAKRQPRRAN